MSIKQFKNNGTWLSQMTNQAAFGLTDQISALGPGIKGIEIGVNHGTNSCMLLDACMNINMIYGVDPYLEYMDWSSLVPQSIMDMVYKSFLDNQECMGNRFELIKMKSEEAADLFEDESVDFIFIDGDHSVKGVMTDLIKYVPKVKKGGIIAGHDIGLKTVQLTLNTWLTTNNISADNVHIVENQAWYWIKE